MRTAEQIENLRNVFRKIHGPLVMFWSDEDIDFLGDALQNNINRTSMWIWEIRVATKWDPEDGNWKDIKPEPKTPRCTIDTINRKCYELIKKYPTIVAIFVSATENKDLHFVFQNESSLMSELASQ